jgi:hypothetical protein
VYEERNADGKLILDSQVQSEDLVTSQPSRSVSLSLQISRVNSTVASPTAYTVLVTLRLYYGHGTEGYQFRKQRVKPCKENEKQNVGLTLLIKRI